MLHLSTSCSLVVVHCVSLAMNQFPKQDTDQESTKKSYQAPVQQGSLFSWISGSIIKDSSSGSKTFKPTGHNNMDTSGAKQGILPNAGRKEGGLGAVFKSFTQQQ